MRFRPWILGLSVGHLLMAITQPAGAQADSGSRVRVTTNVGLQRRWTGALISAGADSVRLTSSRDGRVVSFPTATVMRLEQSHDRRTNAGGGAVIGALIGGGTGLVLGLLASSEDDSWFEVGPGEIAAASLTLAAMGGGLGAIIGAVSHRERWEPMPIPGRPATQVGTRRYRLTLVVRF